MFYLQKHPKTIPHRYFFDKYISKITYQNPSQKIMNQTNFELIAYVEQK